MNLPEWVGLANVDGHRVRFPGGFAKLAGVDHISPESSIECWLIVLKAGRFLLQRQDQVRAEDLVTRVLRYFESLASHDSADESEEEIAKRARLFSCTVTWHERGPRLNLPKEIFYLTPGEKSQVYFVRVVGLVEIWFPEILQRATAKHLPELFS
jgi:hypothetical protein